jgi:ferredoxin--NADP+ reductase
MVLDAPGSAFATEEIERLRREHYNATMARIVRVHSDLWIIRIVPDAAALEFEPGQYVTLGLGNWEARVLGVDEEELDAIHQRRLTMRAYSISCSMLDDDGRLRRPTDFPYLELYITLVRHSERRPPALTPRLFAMREGSRLFVSPHAAGHYTLSAVRPTDDVFLFATGTGEAPHNAMIAELLAREHQGRIVNAVSVRWLRDAAYWKCHSELMKRFPNYRYALLATRESAPPADKQTCVVHSQRFQDMVRSGDLERKTGVPLDPIRAHVFLCGNPKMIGVTPRSAVAERILPGSMLDLLSCRGFRSDYSGQQGNVHFERYW